MLLIDTIDVKHQHDRSMILSKESITYTRNTFRTPGGNIQIDKIAVQKALQKPK